MERHLRKFFPENCRKLGDVGLLETIRLGVERAASYQISSERDVCKYIDLMLALGPDFDRDPKLPRVARLLGNTSLDSSGARIDEVFDVALIYIESKSDFPSG